MRIFKNRGDIFFSKSDRVRSAEQKFLFASLVIIVVFSLVFVTAFAARNDFSVKKFFEPEETTAVTVSGEDNDVILPQISGKSNYLLTVGEEEYLLYAVLIQADKDNTAVKASCLRADTVCDGESLEDIYSRSGVSNVSEAVQTLFDIEIDYYIAFEEDDFISFYNDLGEINYAVADAVRFKDSDSAVPYSVRLSEGELSLKGSQLSGLLRYYLNEENNTSAANELVLTMLSQQLNDTNYENSDELFNLLISNVQTNITVREYSLAGDALLVFSNSRSGVKVYNAAAEYEKSRVTNESIKEVRGYFVK